jgi:hypothetical protein
MEQFIDNVISILEDINNQKEHKSLLIDNIIIQKQYLVYYMYRILCYHFSYIRSLALTKNIKEINLKLGISSNYKYICSPLAGRMTNDETQLNDIFATIIKLFQDVIKKSTELKRDIKEITSYFEKKNKNQIIKDIKELVKFVPNLSKYQYYI